MIFNNISELIGKTPLVKINKSAENIKANIWAKLEYFNPASSVKDRIALAMIEAAEKSGLIKNNTILIEPTSGNTGIGLAFIAATKGLKLLLVMPDTMSIERRKLMAAFGAEFILTPGSEGMPGAIKKAIEIVESDSRYLMLQQFKNPANVEIHRNTTASEIIKDTEGKIDIFVAGVGTGGTITGVGEILKQHNPSIKVIAVEPADSAVISGGKAGAHKIQGIGAGFIPEILNTKIIDEIIQVKNDMAGKSARELALKDGILVGISSGAALWAALEVAKRAENIGKNIVVILPDSGERYLSTWLYEDLK
ncbi:MAG: cysteine synthase A [Oligoflexia bacterium]|nr:cysteine synthase A [Oligoflexia bacterium]